MAALTATARIVNAAIYLKSAMAAKILIHNIETMPI